ALELPYSNHLAAERLAGPHIIRVRTIGRSGRVGIQLPAVQVDAGVRDEGAAIEGLYRDATRVDELFGRMVVCSVAGCRKCCSPCRAAPHAYLLTPILRAAPTHPASSA